MTELRYRGHRHTPTPSAFAGSNAALIYRGVTHRRSVLPEGRIALPSRPRIYRGIAH